jgi:hypothetical protein
MSAAQAPLIGGLLILVFHGCDPYSGALMFCLTISALWFGIFSSVREIVAEYAVYQRERLLGLSVSAYVFSKIPLLCVVSFAQSVVLLALVFPVLASDRTAATGENLLRVAAMLGILTLTAAGGVALGLALSALALILGRRTATRTGMMSSEVAMSLVPLALLPQIILGGPFYLYDEAWTITRWLSNLTLARWSLGALLSLETSGPRTFARQMGLRDASALASCGAIALLSGVYVLVTIAVMKWHNRSQGS